MPTAVQMSPTGLRLPVPNQDELKVPSLFFTKSTISPQGDPEKTVAQSEKPRRMRGSSTQGLYEFIEHPV